MSTQHTRNHYSSRASYRRLKVNDGRKCDVPVNVNGERFMTETESNFQMWCQTALFGKYFGFTLLWTFHHTLFPSVIVKQPISLYAWN